LPPWPRRTSSGLANIEHQGQAGIEASKPAPAQRLMVAFGLGQGLGSLRAWRRSSEPGPPVSSRSDRARHHQVAAQSAVSLAISRAPLSCQPQAGRWQRSSSCRPGPQVRAGVGAAIAEAVVIGPDGVDQSSPLVTRPVYCRPGRANDAVTEVISRHLRVTLVARRQQGNTKCLSD